MTIILEQSKANNCVKLNDCELVATSKIITKGRHFYFHGEGNVFEHKSED